MMHRRLGFCLALAALGLVSCTENPPPAREQTMLEKKQEARAKFFENLNRPPVAGSPNMAAQLGGPASLSGTTTTTITGGPGAINPTTPTRLAPGPSLNTVGTDRSLAPSPRDAAIDVPANAQWTLVCLNLTTQDRIQRMAQMKTYLLAHTPLKNWYIIHDDQKSSLYYGFYGSIHANDPVDPSGRQAQADKKYITEWKDPGTGDKPFAQCMFTRIAEPEPPAPAEWRLTNAPADGYWSLQIAAFQGDMKRKEAAVEAVREMRSRGIEAYYYHGNTVSSVCVGAWPRTAIREQEADGGRAIVNQEDALFVSNLPLPDYLKHTKMNKDGQKIVGMSERVEIQDKSLLAAQKDYPYHYVNYSAMVREGKDAQGKKVDVVAPSFLVVVPRDAGAVAAETANFMNPRGAGTVNAPRTPRPAPTGIERLRSIDDPSPR